MQNLKKLSDEKIEISLRGFVKQERGLLKSILALIQEVDRRKLYLKRGRPSLFEFLTKDFGYSPASAQRRIDAARLSVEVEGVLEKIEKGSLNLTQVSSVQKAIRLKEKTEKVSLDTKKEALREIERHPAPDAERVLASFFDLPRIVATVVKTQEDSSVRLSITLSPEEWAQLQRCKELLAHKVPRGAVSDVLKEVLGFYLRAKDPLLRTATSAAEVAVQQTGPVPQATRRFVFQRDKVCQYKDKKTGRVCESKFQLEVDHIKMRCHGGTNEPENLRLLCRAHNQLVAQEALSPTFPSFETRPCADPSP